MENKQDIPRLIIATGDDSFAIELSREKYLERINSLHGECIVEMFDSLNEGIGEFMSRAVTASLFQEIRLYCVLHAQSMSEKDLGALDRYLDYKIPDVYLFVSAETDKKAAGGTKVAKCLQLKKRAADKSVSVQDFSRPPDYKLAEWVTQQVPALFNRRIGLADAEHLAKIVDYDLIYSELQKIDMALPAGANIDKNIIDEITGVTRAANGFEFAAALGKRDLPGALEILDSLFSGDFYAPLAVSAVFKQFWSMLKIRKFLEKNPQTLKQFNTKSYGKDSPQSVAAFHIGVAGGLLTEKTKNRVYPAVIKSGIVAQAQSFSEGALREILKTLQRFDVDSKTGRVEPTPYNFQMLCYRIVRAV
jgi:DNA polymerase III delta subunit